MSGSSAEVALDLVVRERLDPTDGVVVLRLESATGGDLPRWEAGAHIDIFTEGDTCRQYSLCGSPQDRKGYRIAILEEPDGRGCSRVLYRTAVEGSTWRMRGPRTNFVLESSDSYVFIAGGIGITPIIPMMEDAERRGASWQLLYGGRSRMTMAFLDELKAYGDRGVISPEDENGLLPLDEWLDRPTPGTLVYCCGPEALLQAVEQRCVRWPRGSLHTERFAPKQLEQPVLAVGFEVQLKRSGMVLEVPVDRSILEVVAEAGIPTLSACQEGTCGTCETAVIEGVPDHRDSILDEDEKAANDYMMICVSRSCSARLVLDL